MDYILILKKAIIGIIAIILFLILFKLSFYFIPFLIAYIISILVEPIIKYLCKKIKISRKLSSIIVLSILFGILIFILAYSGIKLTTELSNLSSNINSYIETITSFINIAKEKIDILNLPKEVIDVFETSISEFIDSIATSIKNFLTNILKYISSIPNILINIIITILATYFITSDKFYILDRMEHHLSRKMVGKLSIHAKEITVSLGKYLKAEIILSFITFLVVLTGLNIFYLLGMEANYPLVMALIIGFVDALPILGAGFIMIPWSIILFLSKNASLGIAILGLYVFTLIEKQFVEPKLVSSNIGIHPIFTLISMYTFFKITGIIGLIIGPIILIILKNIFSDVLDKGIVNSLVDT